MLKRALPLLCAIGCGGGGDLTMNVVVSDDLVALYARDVGSDCTCTAGEWPEPGDCVGWSDGVSCTCDPGPASCVNAVRLERDGDLLAESGAQDIPGIGWALSADLAAGPAELVVSGCGGAARIPIDLAGSPQPTIDELSDDGETLRLRWSSTPPAASALVGVGDGFAGEVCHDTTGLREERSWRDSFAEEVRASVHAFAAPRRVDTPLGEARVWAGGRATETLTLGGE